MPTKPYIVYVIDDSPYDLLIATELIEEFCSQADIHCFKNAQEALTRLQALVATPKEFPELLFLDIRMPVMDGFAFLEAYSLLPSSLTHQCKLYILSSSLDPKDIEKAKAHPLVVDFLEKPLEEQFLKSVFTN